MDHKKYLERLEDFEKRFGKEWVRSKFSLPPQRGTKYYDFGVLMHKAFIRRENLLKQALEIEEVSNNKDVDIYYTDGGTTNNGKLNQESRICVIKNGKLLTTKSVGNKTNNQAEYLALIEALKLRKKAKKAIVYCDSQLIVNSIKRNWKMKKSPHLKELQIEALGLVDEDIDLKWIVRDNNLAGQYLENIYRI